VGKRSLPPSPPTGPVKSRTTTTKPPTPITSLIATPVAVTARSLPQLHLRISVSAPPTRSPSLERPETIIPPAPPSERKYSKLLLKSQDEWRDEVNSIEAPLHSHLLLMTPCRYPLILPRCHPPTLLIPNSTSNNASPLPNHNPNHDAPLLPNTTTMATPTLESPIEVFIEDLHHSTLSRSSYPVRPTGFA